MKLHKLLLIFTMFFIITLTCQFNIVQAMSFPSNHYLEEEDTPYLNTQTLALAIGSPVYSLTINHSTYTTWSSSNMLIATVDNFGQITALSEGNTIITATATSVSGKTYVLTCDLQITNPQLSNNTIEICLSEQNYVPITIDGLQSYSTISWSSQDPTIAQIDLYGKSIYGFEKGSTILTAVIDGKTLTCEVNVTDNATISKKEFFSLAVGQTKSLLLKEEYENIIWSSKNPKIASVSKTGVVKAKKSGTAQIVAQTDTLSFTWYISVANSTAIKAVSDAYSTIGSAYSQEKRMEEGYYDCSSFTWKIYSPYGITFGEDTWAPTAAAQAKWCVQNNKIIAKNSIDINELELLPGDLIFYAKNKNNNRYKNIYHVALFTGYQVNSNNDYSAFSSEKQTNSNLLQGTIIEANGTQVSENYYRPTSGTNNKIVFIARPTL